MNDHPSPEFEKELHETFRASGADPAFVHDLRATLLERANMKKETRSFYRLVWGLVAAVLLIGLLAASPRVVEALKRILGYVPGIGYVEQGAALRTLSAPATVEKDGLKLTVEKVVADSQRTILLAHIEGYPLGRYSEQSCESPTQLVLPDGTILHMTASETSSEGGKEAFNGSYYERDTFEAMPAGQMAARLEIPCVMHDQGFTDFTLQLDLELAKETQIIPVIELPTQSAGITPLTNPTAVSGSSAESTLEGFSIVLESETPLPDGYILSGSYRWTDPRFDVTSVQINDPEITDARGEQVNFESVDPVVTVDPAVKKLPFAYEIHGKNHAYPLTITVNSMMVTLSGEGTFQFDAGENPQVGQVWNVNIAVPVGEHIIHVQTIQLTAGRTPTELGFTFTMTSDPAVRSASILDANPVINGGGGGSGGGGGGGNDSFSGFTNGWAIDGYSPAGVKTFVVSDVIVRFHTSWQVTWQPSTK